MRNIYKLFLLAFAFVLIQSCSKSEPDSISVSSGAIGTSGVQIPNNTTHTTLSITRATVQTLRGSRCMV